MRTRLLVCGFVGVFLVACGSAETDPSASESLAVEPAPPCTVAPGLYMVKYTRRSGDITCTPFWQRQTDSDGRPEDDASAGCAITSDPATCGAVIDCLSEDSGTSSKTEVATTVANGNVTGTFHGVVSMGGHVVSDCFYDLVWERQ